MYIYDTIVLPMHLCVCMWVCVFNPYLVIFCPGDILYYVLLEYLTFNAL